MTKRVRAGGSIVVPNWRGEPVRVCAVCHSDRHDRQAPFTGAADCYAQLRLDLIADLKHLRSWGREISRMGESSFGPALGLWRWWSNANLLLHRRNRAQKLLLVLNFVGAAAFDAEGQVDAMRRKLEEDAYWLFDPHLRKRRKRRSGYLTMLWDDDLSRTLDRGEWRRHSLLNRTVNDYEQALELRR